MNDARSLERAARHPVLLTEKIFYKIVHDRNPLLGTFADKVAVRDYVAERIGEHYLTRAYTVSATPDIDWDALPATYVAKAAHGSGGAVVVSPYAPPDARLPTDLDVARWGTFTVRRENVQPDRMRALFADWLSLDFSVTHSTTYPEWCYTLCERRILIEEFLDAGTVSPPDYKFFMAHGECLFIQYDSDRIMGHRRVILTPDWTWLPVRLGYDLTAPAPPRPPQLAEMLRVAAQLSAETDFVRVDLYALDDRVVFGELTNYPNAGRLRFQPRSFDRRMGRRWQGPRYPSEKLLG
ncbi:MAG: ATP-grasp fold amidoligase family protein [Rhodoglobus sp.]